MYTAKVRQFICGNRKNKISYVCLRNDQAHEAPLSYNIFRQFIYLLFTVPLDFCFKTSLVIKKNSKYNQFFLYMYKKVPIKFKPKKTWVKETWWN